MSGALDPDLEPDLEPDAAVEQRDHSRTPAIDWAAIQARPGPRPHPPRPAVILHPSGGVFDLVRQLQEELRPLVLGVRCRVPWPHLTLVSVPRTIGFERIAEATAAWAAQTPPLAIRAERMTTRRRRGRIEEKTVALTLSDDGSMLEARERLLAMLGVRSAPRVRPQGWDLVRSIEHRWMPHVTLLQCGRADEETWRRIEELAELAEFPAARETLTDSALRLIEGDRRHERRFALRGAGRTPAGGSG